MSSNRRLRKHQNAYEDSSILFYFLLLILFYPPLFRGLFFSKELLVTHILTAALFMAVVYFKSDNRSMELFRKPMDFAALGFLLVYIITSFFADVPRDAAKETLKLANYVMIYYLVTHYAVRELYIRRILEVFYASGLLVAIIGILSVFGLNVRDGVLSGRIASTLQYPNTLAAYMLAIFLIGLYLYPRYKEQYKSYLVCAGNTLVFITLLWTKSRGGFLFLPVPIILLLLGISEKRKDTIIQLIQSVVIAMAVYTLAVGVASPELQFALITAGVIASIVLHIVINKLTYGASNFSLKKWHYGIILGVIAVGCAIVFFTSPVGEQVSDAFSRISTTSLQERNVQERMIFYKDALKVFKDSPIFGHGGGGWAGVYQKYQAYAYQSTEIHNNYLQVMIETGLLGFLIYVGLWVSFILLVIKNHKTLTSDRKDQNWLAFSVTSAIALTSIVDFNMTFGSISILLWSMFGMVRGLAASSQTELKEKDFVLTTDKDYAKIISLAVPAVVLIFSLSLSIGLSKGTKGHYLFNSDRISAAERELNSAVTFDPLNASNNMVLSQIWGAKGVTQKRSKDNGDKDVNEAIKTALKYAEKAVELEPNNPEAHVVKGKAHLVAEQVPQAVSEYEKAVSLAPTNQKSYNQLADVLLRAGKYYTYVGQKNLAADYLKKVMDVPKMIEGKAREIPFSADMPWIKKQYNLSVDKELQKTMQDAQKLLGQL